MRYAVRYSEFGACSVEDPNGPFATEANAQAYIQATIPNHMRSPPPTIDPKYYEETDTSLAILLTNSNLSPQARELALRAINDRAALRAALDAICNHPIVSGPIHKIAHEALNKQKGT